MYQITLPMWLTTGCIGTMTRRKFVSANNAIIDIADSGAANICAVVKDNNRIIIMKNIETILRWHLALGTEN